MYGGTQVGQFNASDLRERYFQGQSRAQIFQFAHDAANEIVMFAPPPILETRDLDRTITPHIFRFHTSTDTPIRQRYCVETRIRLQHFWRGGGVRQITTSYESPAGCIFPLELR